MAQDHVERHAVKGEHGVEAGLDGAINAAVTRRFTMHEARAQHRRKRERNKRRHRDGCRYGERKFPEQAANDAAHEQERYEHRDQRNADGEHRKADLARAFERGRKRCCAVLDVTMNVFDHDDGVVDHKAHSDGERHQRDIVEAEIEQIHRPAGTQQRQRHGDAGNESGPEVAQEEKNDQHDQSDGERQGELNVAHGSAYGDGPVEHGLDLHGRRDSGSELRELRLDLIDRVDDVRARLLENGQHDARLVVVVGGNVAIDRFRNGLADIAHADGRTIAISQDDVIELRRVGDLIVGGDGEAEFVGVDGAFGGIGGRAHQRAADLLERNPGRRELGGVDLDADRRLLVAEDHDLGDTGDLRDLLCQEKIGIIVDLGQRHGIGARREQEDR